MRKFSNEEAVLFIYGYLYRLAEEAKERGLFQDLTANEVVGVYIKEYFKEN